MDKGCHVADKQISASLSFQEQDWCPNMDGAELAYGDKGSDQKAIGA